MKKWGRIPAVLLAIVMVLLSLSLTGCIKPYDKPEFVEVSPSQTAVVVPLEGKTSDQAAAPSAEFFKQNLVYQKRIQVPHRWIQEGRIASTGRYVPTVRVILVERKPSVRAWTAANNTGTSQNNEAIGAESKESIAFQAQMTASAQIDEANVPTFLYRYNGKSLEEIMDTDIRNFAAGQFAENCAKYTIDEILVKKAEIMDVVRKETIETFKTRGITITSLNLINDFNYNNEAVQASIDKKFQSERDYQSAKFQAKQADLLSNNSVALKIKQLELDKMKLENQKAWIEQWNGVAPLYWGINGGSFFGMPTTGK